MKLRKLSVLACGLFGITMGVHANEVLFTANQSMKIIFRIAHLNHNSQPVLGEPQSMEISKNTTFPIDMNNYDLAGVIILSVNGHELPLSANQFNQPKQCSMTTDKTKATGTLAFSLSAHEISCRSYGGVFG
ncbi:hypothetical protein Lrub_0367 [Legionella rubrilucens]|uniref:VirK protein n=1 Tax=Legionella rubrilucens TaxID=458 RepID=A0A0W0XZE0_9GAMM|nr:hypothetical protein [Legionella rubrilucens]KTD49925.1 hypothetical protein Lrub_0367 [Legionella rubrilucens]